jgi:hypothetical protein
MIAIADLLAAHRQAVIARVLRLIAASWQDAKFTRWVDPQRILAEAWHAGRLADAKARLSAGERAPAISVVGYRWDSDWTIYEPSDGIHRTVAARDAGKRVKAKITGYHYVRPAQFLVCDDDLWRRVSGDRLEHVDAIVDAERAALAALGVPQ